MRRKNMAGSENRKTYSRGGRHAKKRKSSPGIIIVAALLLVIIALLAVFISSRAKSNIVYKTNTLEAGDVVLTPDMFLKDTSKPIAFDPDFDPNEIDTRTPGTYTVKLISGRIRLTAELKIEDTTLPTAQARPVTTPVGVPVKADALVKNVSDNSYVFSVSFETEPDFSKAGTYNVNILIRDAGGNVASVPSVLTVSDAADPVSDPVDGPVEPDTEPPVIYGVHDITIYVGEGISYFSGVYAEDDRDGTVKVELDADSVNTKAAGKYTITYSSTDSYGNRAEKTAKVTVLVRTVEEEEVTRLAKSVVSKIITSDMTGYEKISAIYKWVRSNVSWYDSSDKDDWVKAAYQGLHDGKGDCFVYQMVSKVLLDAAGIENKLIDTVPLRYLHCWNLVNIGEGWFHFDTTPRKGGFDGFYLDDETLMAYSETHKNSHIYDHEKFPDAVISRPKS